MFNYVSVKWHNSVPPRVGRSAAGRVSGRATDTARRASTVQGRRKVVESEEARRSEAQRTEAPKLKARSVEAEVRILGTGAATPPLLTNQEVAQQWRWCLKGDARFNLVGSIPLAELSVYHLIKC